MTMRWPWPERLGSQIALLVAVALLLELAGSEWLLQRYEQQRVAEQHMDDLIPELRRVDHILSTTAMADRAERLQWLEQASLTLQWQPDKPSMDRPSAQHNAIVLNMAQQQEIAGLRHLFLTSVDGDITGHWQLRDGGWVRFTDRSQPVSKAVTMRHLGAVVIVILILNLVLMLVVRQISRPLQLLADHADGVARAAEAPFPEMGSYEMRQVARAYNDLQSRMAAEVEDRLQSLAAVSHDLRTPIARMSLRVGQVHDPLLRAQMEADLAEMNAFIGAVLDYLSGEDLEAEQLVNVGSLLATIAEAEQDMGREVVYHGSSQLELFTRPVKLQRVVSNLVQNAVRHAGSADIFAQESAGGLEIWVDDHGAGIDPDQLDRVFEPFTRLEGSRNRETGGVGLGLAIVKRSAARLNGRITLVNRAEGGLRASLWLPSNKG